MLPFVFVTGAMLAIVHYDIRPKWRAGNKKELWISAAFLFAAYLILTLRCFDIVLPSPLKPIQSFVRMFFDVP